MKIKLLCMGAVRDEAIGAAISLYAKRIPFYWPFSMVCLPDVKTPKTAGATRQKELEGERFLAEIAPGDWVVLLDERGKQYTSRRFAEMIARKAVELPRNLVFVVGGPYGFSKAVYDRADAMLSLSDMTFPHELVRLFFVEQIYRAGTIIRGEPYHHD
ncbi:MAG: 23S rRNA (pseudouridine(1915)-N(3))-methyltransferase RlmH [Muribaculaceae bacterium]|nr:23S rRNA (pseudouridine(1915)-N(3))-methyltransferase RlmH [Muribaculaceae bacterium]MDE6526354.1 23S rRNA (pseudouridine(1915)-N(3))-methyltransferase RlmH [Muribaculaceae bacterium]